MPAAEFSRWLQRHGVTQHLVSELLWQAVRREHIYFHTQEILEFEANGSDVHQRGLRRGLYQQIKVAANRIVATDGRAEHPYSAHAMAQRDVTDVGAVQRDGFRGTHDQV